MKVKSFKIYTDDSDEDKVLVGNNIETALEILENNGYIVEAEYENVEDIDEDILYDLMRDYGDCEECEIIIYGPLEHEIEEEFEEE